MKHIFYAALFCSFSAHAMDEQSEPAHQRLMRCGAFSHGLWEKSFSHYNLSFSADTNLLAGLRTHYENGTRVRIWDSTSDSGEARASLTLEHCTQAMLLSRNGESLFLGQGREVKVWDVETQQEKTKATISICNDGYVCFAENPTEPTLAVGTGCGCSAPDNLSFVDLRSGKETKKVQMPSCIVSLAYSQKGDKLGFLSENLIPANQQIPCIIVEAVNPQALIKAYSEEKVFHGRPVIGLALAFDADDELHYGYAYEVEGTIFSKNLDTGAITRSENPAQTLAFAFNPKSRRFSTCDSTWINMFRPEELSQAAREIVQRTKKVFGSLAQEKEGIKALEKWERQWVSDHVRDLAKWAANLTFDNLNLK